MIGQAGSIATHRLSNNKLQYAVLNNTSKHRNSRPRGHRSGSLLLLLLQRDPSSLFGFPTIGGKRMRLHRRVSVNLRPTQGRVQCIQCCPFQPIKDERKQTGVELTASKLYSNCCRFWRFVVTEIKGINRIGVSLFSIVQSILFYFFYKNVSEAAEPRLKVLSLVI